ncbi:hypothetical protein [Comamonas sp.]|uniref:hypothetical protein n=1 Tax=Comamonas sp. TaxID=34028 RepID=UPI002FC98A9F
MNSSIENNFFATEDELNRLVVFIGGFDPRGARYYHQLMRSESDKQSGFLEKIFYKVGKRNKIAKTEGMGGGHSQWIIESSSSLKKSSSDFIFFDWHDEVQKNWTEKRWSVFFQAIYTYAAIFKLKEWLAPIRLQARYTLWALMYPLAYVLLVILLGLGLGLLFSTNTESASGAVAVALCFLGLALWGGLALDRYIHVSWLLRILNFAHSSSLKKSPVLDERIDAMAQELAQGMQQARWREVVIVGFSVGSVQAVKLTAALRGKLAEVQSSPHSSGLGSQGEVNLLTLGNCIPLFALFPGAGDFRRSLRDVAQDRQVYWADISSPSDSVCFGMCDVVGLSLREDGVKLASEPSGPESAASGVGKKVGQWGLNPQVMCSPRFHKLFLPETYRWLRRNKMRMHFQYLMAGEVAGAYDYFELLTCPGSLRDYIEKKLVR